MSTGAFATLVQRFFADYLSQQRNLSAHTLRAYRDTFRLFLRFAGARRRSSIDQLSFADFTPAIVLEFLAHLERERGNSIQSRNARLAAVRCFARYCLGHAAPEQLDTCQRILCLPAKRCERRLLGFMNRAEIAAVLAAIPQHTWSGRRDQLLFSLLYNTGARISEILQLRATNVQPQAIRLLGKGRKHRTTPLWPPTAQSLRRWLQTNQIRGDQLVFTNRRGDPLTRDGAAYRLARIVAIAAESCPSLRGRRITPHTFRHTAAMHLLQSGVALEVIALWLGHECPVTTHGYIEADLKMKQQCMANLDQPQLPRRRQAHGNSRLLAFLEAI